MVEKYISDHHNWLYSSSEQGCVICHSCNTLIKIDRLDFQGPCKPKYVSKGSGFKDKSDLYWYINIARGTHNTTSYDEQQLKKYLDRYKEYICIKRI